MPTPVYTTPIDLEDRLLAARALAHAIDAAVERVSIGGMGDDELEALAFVGSPARVRVAAWQELHRRGQDWTVAAECQSCNAIVPEGRTRCEACEREIDEAARLTAAGASLTQIVALQNAQHKVTVEATCRSCGRVGAFAVPADEARLGTRLQTPYECRNNACDFLSSDLVVTAVMVGGEWGRAA